MPSGHINPGNFERPLSAKAWSALALIADEPVPSQDINFGICAKLVRMGYAEYVQRPSPYKSHKDGRLISFLAATDWGVFSLEERKRKRA